MELVLNEAKGSNPTERLSATTRGSARARAGM